MSKLKIINSNLEENKNVGVEKEITSDYSDIITINDFKAKELMHYKKLDNFFNKCSIEEIHSMIDIINGNHLISLRFLDWFVTRYCYLYKLSINIDNTYCNENNFNINISYKAQLKSFKKKYFDPFRRKKKFYYFYDNNKLSILTTIGQLNFFRWALNYDIIKFTETNYRDIILKLTHVNSYFKKNLIENNSYSTTSDELIESSKSTTDSTELKSNNSDVIIGDKVSNKVGDTSSEDLFSNHKNKSKYKNPLVSRNIFLEF